LVELSETDYQRFIYFFGNLMGIWWEFEELRGEG